MPVYNINTITLRFSRKLCDSKLNTSFDFILNHKRCIHMYILLNTCPVSHPLNIKAQTYHRD